MKQMFDIADQKGVSLASLCDKMDVYPNQITDWRAGRHTPSIFVIMGLADALGLELVLKDR
jgi:transcriptional regulator with XRE-family HTH domain